MFFFTELKEKKNVKTSISTEFHFIFPPSLSLSRKKRKIERMPSEQPITMTTFATKPRTATTRLYNQADGAKTNRWWCCHQRTDWKLVWSLARGQSMPVVPQTEGRAKATQRFQRWWKNVKTVNKETSNNFYCNTEQIKTVRYSFLSSPTEHLLTDTHTSRQRQIDRQGGLFAYHARKLALN